MRIEVLGPGCKNCETLYENVLKALDQAGLQDQAEVVKMKDIDYFMKMGVFATPGLVCDGQVLSTGMLLNPDQVLEKLRAKGVYSIKDFSMGDQTNVFLITGFLGSGKTTFLNRIIRDFPRDKKLMILMNEFGELDVDGTLVQDDDIDLLEISKGSIFCVCVKTDFIKGLQRIAKDIQPDVLLIESTGVANPTDLKRDLTLPFFNNRFNLAEQFCVIDAVHFEEEYEVFSSVEKQIASSTVFIINKVDVATAEQVRQVKDLVARHHPAPVFFETTYADFPFQEFFFKGLEPSAQTGVETRARYLTSQELEEAIERMLADPNREITPPDRPLSAIYAWKGGGLKAS